MERTDKTKNLFNQLEKVVEVIYQQAKKEDITCVKFIYVRHNDSIKKVDISYDWFTTNLTCFDEATFKYNIDKHFTNLEE